MLIMRRRAGESILIGEEIQIHITEIGRNRVKVAIDAPKHVRIVAREWQLVEEENRRALAGSRADLDALVTRFSRPGPKIPQTSPPGSDEGVRFDPTGS